MTSRKVSMTLRLIIALQIIQLVRGQGAVYTMRNGADSNAILINSIGTDGQLKYERAVEIPGAKGAGRIGELHSANSLIQKGNFLFCVNAGSDSVTSLIINPADPKDVKVVSTESSGGDFPNTLAISSDLKMLCVANGGEVRNSGVFCYTVDTTTGKITPKTGTIIPFGVETIPLPSPRPGFGSPSDMLFIENDRFVIVSIKGAPVRSSPFLGKLVSFPVDSTSQPTQLKPPIINDVGVVPYAMNVLNPGSGADVIGYLDPAKSEVHILSFNGGRKGRGNMVTLPKQKNICWSEISPQNKRYYIIDADDKVTGNGGSGAIHELTFDIPTLNISHLGSLSAITRNLLDGRIVTVGAKDILYVIQVKDADADQKDTHGIVAVEVHPGPMKVIQSHYKGPDGKTFPQSMHGMAFFSTKA